MSGPPGAAEAEPSAAAYPDDLRDRVERYLEGLEFSAEPDTAGLGAAMRYSLLAGGKRIRPVLTLAAARALGEGPEHVLPTAAALELIHTYSLIHDDLPAMDDDDLRRGRPTCHIAFGENVAVLAGDGLFAEAYRLVLGRQRGDADRVLAALRTISEAIGVGGMVGGQYVDVAGDTDLGETGLRHMHELKTGRLITASVAVAPALLGAAEPARATLHRFGAEIGVLFQIVDDILDVTGSEDEMGKQAGADQRLGKRTYVSVFGLERASALAAESHARARATLAGGRHLLAGDTSDLERMADFMFSRNA